MPPIAALIRTSWLTVTDTWTSARVAAPTTSRPRTRVGAQQQRPAGCHPSHSLRASATSHSAPRAESAAPGGAAAPPPPGRTRPSGGGQQRVQPADLREPNPAPAWRSRGPLFGVVDIERDRARRGQQRPPSRQPGHEPGGECPAAGRGRAERTQKRAHCRGGIGPSQRLTHPPCRNSRMSSIESAPAPCRRPAM